MSTIKTLLKDLFPKKNRASAARAFVRTFWQGLKGISRVVAPLALVATAADLVTFDWTGLGIGVGLVLLSSVAAGLDAAGDILVNGVPDVYQKTATKAIVAKAVAEAKAPESGA